MSVIVRLLSLRIMFCVHGYQICYKLCYLNQIDVDALTVLTEN
jgi:hypothetical protein